MWRRIILALFIGVWLGAALTGPHDPARSLFHTVWTYTLPTLWSVGSMSMIVFTLLLMGMVGMSLVRVDQCTVGTPYQKGQLWLS